jgi:DNA mismatch repair protein MutS2
MKAYGQSTSGVSCASFGYDPDSYEPTYELSFGTPGRSLALEMAERLGLPAEVVTDARSRLDEKQAQAEALLGQLELERAALAEEGERVAREREELTGERERLARAETEIEVRKRRELETFTSDLRKQSDQAARHTDEAIRKAVLRLEAAPKPTGAAPRARTEARRQIGRAEREALAGASRALGPEAPEPAQQIEAGSRVRVRDLGFVGEVLGFRDGLVIVTAGGKRLQVPRGLLTPVEGGGRGAPPVRAEVTRAKGSDFAPGEINLVGLTVDEALPRVDKLLDDAALSERRELRVIHGFGQGRLRSAVAGLLDGHPHVAAFRLGRAGEGGGGVTVVELKD